MKRSTWRILYTPPAPGAWNMALDEAVLEAASRRESLPVLRLYAWEPACLSLGFAQPFSDVDLAALNGMGWDIVRRPTGGRAILHTDELTYSVAGPQDEPRLAGSVLESYRVLSEALLYALHLLNIPAESNIPPAASRRDPKQPQEPVCFEVPSNYEITIGGKKIIGSAQARRQQGVLQHGSLPLYGDLTRITRVLAYPDETVRQKASERLISRAATAGDALGRPLSWEEAANAFAQAFSTVLDLQLEPGEPTASEMKRAEELLQQKYRNPSWTERV